MIERFHGIHAGETCLLVGNGKNLHLTPPYWFEYPSFGTNTIHKYEGWMPTYYVTVDERVVREFGEDIIERFRDIPKFIPHPDLDTWKGENFYRWYHRPGVLFPQGGMTHRNKELLTKQGLCYGNIMQVAMQLAAWMGFTTLLMIGVEHAPQRAREHFWGMDEGQKHEPPVKQWLNEYREIAERFEMYGIRVLNISQDTHVSADILPRGDWREWRNHESENEGTLSGRESPLRA